MVDQTNIFGAEGSVSETTGTPATQAFQVPEAVNEFIGDGKKYTDVNKALESIPHAQTHIDKLEQELTEVRAKLSAAATIEDTLAQFASKQEQGTPTSQPVDLQEIANLVDQRLVAKDQVNTQASNINDVVSKLSVQFGDQAKAEAAFISKASELGVDVSYMNNLAATSPAAVYALFGTKAQVKSQEFTRSSVNTEALGSTDQTQQPIPSVMSGSSSTQVIDAWRKATAHLGD